MRHATHLFPHKFSVGIKMYDFSEEEESSLPLPANWVRMIDTTGNLIYKHLSSGNLAEEHPFILQGLDVARKLPLPKGWVVKETTLSGGVKDYFYCNPLFDLSGWDPPQFRSCLAECLMKNGFPEAAVAVLEHPNNQLVKYPGVIPPVTLPQQSTPNGGSRVQQEEQRKPLPGSHSLPIPVEDSATDHADHITATAARNVDWMGLMEHLGSLEEPSSRPNYTAVHLPPPSPDPPEDVEYLTGDEHEYEQYTEKTDNESLYSLTSRRSRRSDRWIELLKQPSQKKLTTSDLRSSSSQQHGQHGVFRPSEITTKSLNRLIACQIDANEKCHMLLIQLRSQLCKRSNLTCNLLAYHNLDSDVGSLDTNTLCDHPYRIDQINTMITLGEGLISFLRTHIELLVMGLASIPANSPELLVTSYAILHRIFHPFSSEASMTTSFLLESLNYQIECTCSQLEDPQQTLHGRHTTSRECSRQEVLLVTLLTNTLVGEVSTQYQPLHRPVFSYSPAGHPTDEGGGSHWPEYSLTLFGVLLRSYGIRRDVTSFFRLIWRQVLPALCAVIETSEMPANSSTSKSSPPRRRPDHLLETLTFGKLIPIATRILECTFLDESLVLYPATATAVIRCLGEICGYPGIHIYLLEFLVLPNLMKLLLGDVESIDNEEPLKYQNLWNHSEKYFDHRNWWPYPGYSFVESLNHQLLTILDGSGMLIWCVWRLYICAIFMSEEILINFTVKLFLSPLDLNASFAGLSDAKLRTILLRIRSKISKGCDSLLQMPLDEQGASFLQSHIQQRREEIKNLKVQTRNISNLLRTRLKSLMLKPPEALNATVMSRYETMILFDSISFVCDKQLDEYEATLPPVELQRNPSYHEFQFILQQANEFLSLSDDLDTQHVDLYSEDIMFFWRTPDPRHWRIPSSQEFPSDDISVFTQDTNFFPLPPPPPLDDAGNYLPAAPPLPMEDLVYSYDQLQRGHNLSQRYIASLNRMLHHLRLHRHSSAPTSNTVVLTPLRSLLDSEEWFYCPEVDISCPLAEDNHLSRHFTESHSKKLKPNHFGLEISAQQQRTSREDFVPLKSQLHEFFDSFRFHNSSRSAGANTSIDLSNKPPVKIIRPLPTDPVSYLSGNDIRRVSESRTSYRTKKPVTKITLPESSPLLVPTESYAQQKVSKRTLADIDKEFVTSLRTAAPSSLPRRSSSPMLRRQRKQHPIASGTSINVQPFPEHLRRNLRGVDRSHFGSGENAEELIFEENHSFGHHRVPSPITAPLGHSTPNLLRRRGKVRKMPLPVEDLSGSIFAPTESRLRQLNQEKHRLEEELTVEQEKGWKNLLRSYDQVSDGSSMRTKPFRPPGSGFVGPSSEHSSRSHSTRPQSRIISSRTTAPPLVDIFQSRGIDVKTFLMKLDQAAESSDSQSEGQQQSRHTGWVDQDDTEEARQIKGDDIFESLPLNSLSLFQSLLKRATAPADSLDAPDSPHTSDSRATATPAPAIVIDEKEVTSKESTSLTPHPLDSSRPSKVNSAITLQTNVQSHLPSSTLSPISTEYDDSSILFPGLNGEGDGENDIFEFSFENAKGLGKILSAAKTEHAISERPLNLQKRLMEKNHPICHPIEAEPKNSPSSQSQDIPPAVDSPAIPDADHSLQSEPSVDSESSLEGNKPHMETHSSSVPESPSNLGPLPHMELPISRIYRSSLDSKDSLADDSISSPPIPSSAETTPLPEGSSPKRIPILRKQLSLTPNDLRTQLVRGFEVVKHNASGYPKPKLVAYEPSTNEIVWRSSKKDRFSFMRSSSSLIEKTIPLRDITEVRRGIQTEVLMKGGLLDPGRCVSLVTPYRTLDLVFGSNKDRELFVRSMAVLLEESPGVIFR